MPKHKVGEINGNEVIYISEKDVIFCKNTAVKFPIIECIIRNKEDKGEIPEKNLTIIKDNGKELTEEHKKNISEALRGRCMSEG